MSVTTERASFEAARSAGLAKRQAARIIGKNQCHYCNDQGNRCSAEVADPLAQVALCTKHLARVVEYVHHIQARINSKETTA